MKKIEKLIEDWDNSAILWFCRNCGTVNLVELSWLKLEGTSAECIRCSKKLRVLI